MPSVGNPGCLLSGLSEPQPSWAWRLKIARISRPKKGTCGPPLTNYCKNLILYRMVGVLSLNSEEWSLGFHLFGHWVDMWDLIWQNPYFDAQNFQIPRWWWTINKKNRSWHGCWLLQPLRSRDRWAHALRCTHFGKKSLQSSRTSMIIVSSILQWTKCFPFVLGVHWMTNVQWLTSLPQDCIITRGFGWGTLGSLLKLQRTGRPYSRNGQKGRVTCSYQIGGGALISFIITTVVPCNYKVWGNIGII